MKQLYEIKDVLKNLSKKNSHLVLGIILNGGCCQVADLEAEGVWRNITIDKILFIRTVEGDIVPAILDGPDKKIRVLISESGTIRLLASDYGCLKSISMTDYNETYGTPIVAKMSINPAILCKMEGIPCDKYNN